MKTMVFALISTHASSTQEVRLLTFTFPILLASDAATSVEKAAMMLVTKKIEPRVPSSTPYCERKKNVNHDLFGSYLVSM